MVFQNCPNLKTFGNLLHKISLYMICIYIPEICSCLDLTDSSRAGNLFSVKRLRIRKLLPNPCKMTEQDP